MAIDPSIVLNTQPVSQQNNSLGSLSGTLGLANQAQTLKQNQQQLQANQVFSKAYQESTDPTTGNVDFNKLQALAASGGAGAYLPQFMGQVAQQRNSQLDYQTKQIELAAKSQADIRSRLGSLMSNPQLGQADQSKTIAQQIVESAQSGALPADQALQYIRTIPTDPTEQQAWVKQHFLTSLEGEAKLKALMPNTIPINTGGNTTLVNIDPLTGKPSQAGQLQNTLSPDAATSPVSVVDPQTGAPMAISRQQFASQTGGGMPAGYDGRYPGVQGQAPQGATSTGPQGGAMGIQTGLAPAELAARTTGATTAAKGAANAAQSLHDQVADAPVRIGYLKDAQTALNNIQTGPGTDFRNQLSSAIQASPGVGEALSAAGVTDPSSIKDYDEYKKIMMNYSGNVSAASGTGTDARLNAAVMGNANPQISKLANQDIIVKTIAAEQYRAAQDQAFQNSGVPPEKFNQWQSQWNKTVDPAAFAFANMDGAQQQAFLGRLQKQGPQKLQQFKQQFVGLVNQGYIQQGQ